MQRNYCMNQKHLNFKHVSYPTFNIAALVDPTIFDFCISCFLQFQLLEAWSYVTSQKENMSITVNKCIAFGCKHVSVWTP